MRASSSRAFAPLSAEATTSAMGVPLGIRNPVHVENSALPSSMFRLPGKCPALKSGAGRASITPAPAGAAFLNSLSVSACSDGSSLNGLAPRRFTVTQIRGQSGRHILILRIKILNAGEAAVSN